ncbi:MAG: rluB [Patescibacteria group bacterium]|nr:rluB [Patescibacteria group bacterium]
MSRRAADAAISDGRVRLGDQTAQLGQSVGEDDVVSLDGQALALRATHAYVILNKPVGYVSSRVRQGNDPTLYELLPPEHRRLRIAGRLDRESSGLILLSDDGDFVHRYTHPSFGKSKIYQLELSRPLAPADSTRLEAGVELNDGPSRLGIVHVDGRHVTVSLSEGRNRQLRRTFGALGYGVEALQRTQMGPYLLAGLAAGQWKTVTAL